MNTQKAPLQIAIDGPVGAGKSDISRKLADRLGILYLYTGVMYRTVALVCLEENIPVENENLVTKRLASLDIALLPAPVDAKLPVRVKRGACDITEQLFSPAVESTVPKVASLKSVRAEMVARQQQIAAGQSVVAEGRDIGLRVLPDAQIKIYLTATLEERAKRRLVMMEAKGEQTSFDTVYADTQKRDQIDMTRAVDPLQKLPDAWELDTTGMTQDEVIDAIVTELTKRGLL